MTEEHARPREQTASDSRPLILCANDDGVFSKGLRVLADTLTSFAQVVVVAPETGPGPMSHPAPLHRPLRLRRVEPDRYALDGTPADCVYLALHLGEGLGEEVRERRIGPVLPRRPDLVVSGINRGINLGQDVFYSGTVAAAREGALRGVPSIAASVEVAADPSGTWTFDPSFAAALVADIARAVLAVDKEDDEPALLLNLNVPAGPIKGVVATRLGNRLWSETVEARIDPRGRPYFWLGGSGVKHDVIPGSDTEAFDAGLSSLSVLSLDLARHDDAARREVNAILAAIQRR